MLSPSHALFMIVCTALAMLTTPALGLFFGGMIRRKNVLATFQGCFILLGAVALQWLVVVRSQGVGWSAGAESSGIPESLASSFELMVAVFAAALISGAVVERVRFGPMTVFAIGWTTLVYDPVAYSVWAPGGWLAGYGVKDFGGGLVVHATAGCSALACALMLGKRRGLNTESLQPHNLTLTAIGTALLWFGWFGLNTGRGWAFTASTAAAFTSTIFGGAAGLIGWSVIERIQKGRATLLGTCTGAVAGLVGVSAAAGFVTPIVAAVIGFVVAAGCYQAVAIKRWFAYDDALDVFGVHGVGGVLGVLAVGLVADPAIDDKVAGLFHGEVDLIVAQAMGVAAVTAYSFFVTAVLWFVVDRAMGLRASSEEEELGLDLSQHGQRGYILGEGDRLGA